MRVKVITVGENRVSYLLNGESAYLKRLKHYCSIAIESVKGEKIKDGRPVHEILEREALRLRKLISRNSITVVLDPLGKEWSSPGLAEKISSWKNQGTKNLIFIIGGPLGICPSLREEADVILALSKLTFPHEMVRLILLEQLYRAFTILRGEKYHK